MFLAKYDLDVYLDLFFGLNSLRIYSSVMFERHISKKHKNVPGSDLNFHWFKMMCNRISRAMMAGGL